MPKFVPRERKHKRLAKHNAVATSSSDVNATEIAPETKSDREARRAHLKEELRAARPQSTTSSKKRKRLDKYVETKLRRDEERDLLKKLERQNVDTTLLLSSKRLGRGTNETKREGFQRVLKEREAGVDVRGDHDVVLFEGRANSGKVQIGDSDSEDDGAGVIHSGVSDRTAVVAPALQQAQSQRLFGSGLKRPLETDEGGEPVIKRRRRKKAARPAALHLGAPSVSSEGDGEDDDKQYTNGWDDISSVESDDGNDDDELEWEGFSADDEGSPAVDDKETSGTSESESGEPERMDFETTDPGRSSAFKDWANAQRNETLGFQPSATPVDDAAARAAFKPRQQSPVEQDPLITATQGSRLSRPAEAITLRRSDDVESARMELPVVQEEQRIMEAVYNNPVIVMCGATGSGKTTQVPQMLFEGGYGSRIGKGNSASTLQSRGLIGVTQPRRVAAVSVAERVAHELGPEYASRVAYQVRYDTTTNGDTAIKFMTDGILLREISQDFILSKYSAIVIDEAHERSVNTDILIGMLSRIVSLRDELSTEDAGKYYPLKLIIMSATMRVSDFAQNRRLFLEAVPPIVQAEGRQYSVTVHFSRRTQRDYVGEMANKVARGHRKLPPGGILVFLTGQQEIQAVLKTLRDQLGGSTAGYVSSKRAVESADQMPLEMDDLDDDKRESGHSNTLEGEDSDSEPEITGLDDDDQEFEVEDDAVEPGPRGMLKAHILPLYASLPTVQQMKVFQPAPVGSRLVVLATNVAETSLTIPGVRYVFDSGRSKEKRYDQATGVQTFEVDWISKASASQRMGRAGRTGPGHVYRLYSSAVYEQFFAEHTVPEILRSPIEGTVLQLKAMDIENVVNFPFPTPPGRQQLAQAEKLLHNLGAIQHGKITDVGRQLVLYPLSPRFGQMLRLASTNNLLAPTIAVVAAMAVGDLLVPEAQVTPARDTSVDTESDSEDTRRGRSQVEHAALQEAQKRHQDYTRAQARLSGNDDRSDVIKLLTAVAAYSDPKSPASFCADHFLKEKGLTEVQQLRRQLAVTVRAQTRLSTSMFPVNDLTLLPPSATQTSMLNQIVAAGFLDQIAIRANEIGAPSLGRKPRRAIEVAYRTLQPSTAEGDVPKTASTEERALAESVFVHPSSVLAHLSVNEMPKFIVYHHLSKATPKSIDGSSQPKTRMHPLTAIGPKTLANLAEGTPLIELGKPIGKIESVAGEMTKKRMCWVGVSLRLPGAKVAGWPLTAWKVVQVNKRGSWEVEEVIQR